MRQEKEIYPGINDSDTLLMSRFAGGDLEAFDLLFRQNAPRAHRIAFRFLCNEEDARDIVQEAFLRVYTSAGSWRPKARFITWLYRIVSNLCFKHQRRARIIQLMSLDAPREGDGSSVVMEIPAHSADGPLSVLERKERQEAVKAAIRTLPPNQRMAVILHRFEELSYKEIAEVLNCSVAAVESLLHRAKLSLRVRLERYFHDEPQVSIHSKVKDSEG